MFELLWKILKKMFGKDEEDREKKSVNFSPQPSQPDIVDSLEEEKEECISKKSNDMEDVSSAVAQEYKESEESTNSSQEDVLEEKEEIAFPFFKSRKYKEKEQEKKKKAKKEQRALKKKIYGPIFMITIAFIICVNLLPLTYTSLFGKEVTVSAVMEAQSNGDYNIVYDFEQDLDNIYSDSKEGDKLPLSKILWTTSLDYKIPIVYIDREKGYFLTKFPHKLSSWENSYFKYLKLKTPKYVNITLKVSPLYQSIINVDINKNNK